MGKKPACSIQNYLKKNNKALYDVFEEACFTSLLTAKKGFGVTLLEPSGADVKALAKLLDDPSKRREVVDVLKCIVLRDGYDLNTIENAVDAHFNKVDIKNVDGKSSKVTLASGHVLTKNNDFVAFDDRNNLFVYKLDKIKGLKTSGNHVDLEIPIDSHGKKQSKTTKGGNNELDDNIVNAKSVNQLYTLCNEKVNAMANVEPELKELIDYNPLASYLILNHASKSTTSIVDIKADVGELKSATTNDLRVMNDKILNLSNPDDNDEKSLAERVREVYGEANQQKLVYDEVRYKIANFMKKANLVQKTPKGSKKERNHTKYGNTEKISGSILSGFIKDCNRQIRNGNVILCHDNINIIGNDESMKHHSIMAFVCSPYFCYTYVNETTNDEWRDIIEDEIEFDENEIYSTHRAIVPSNIYVHSTITGGAEVSMRPLLEFLNNYVHSLDDDEVALVESLAKKVKNGTPLVTE